MLLEIFQQHNEQVKDLVGRGYSKETLQRYITSRDHTRSFLKWKYKVDDIDIKKLNYEFINDYAFWLKSKRSCNQLITVDDLFAFKKELLHELLTALQTHPNLTPKKWMKSHEVRRLLKVSPGTLQTLKSSGILPYTKMGGVHFYDYQGAFYIYSSMRSIKTEDI